MYQNEWTKIVPFVNFVVEWNKQNENCPHTHTNTIGHSNTHTQDTQTPSNKKISNQPQW